MSDIEDFKWRFSEVAKRRMDLIATHSVAMLVDALTVLEALVAALSSVLRPRYHPYYWASF
jgi:hypothetical protein